MAQRSFSATVSEWVRATKERQVAVRNASVQSIVEIMQEPGPSRASAASAIASGAGLGKTKKDGSKGVSKRAFGPISNPGGSGRLPVDTGFLRASLQVSIGETLPPLAETPKDGSFDWDADEVRLTLDGSELSDTVLAVYTAAYARRIEYGFKGRDSLGREYSQAGTRFVALAAQRWVQVVEAECAKAQASVASRGG